MSLITCLSGRARAFGDARGDGGGCGLPRSLGAEGEALARSFRATDPEEPRRRRVFGEHCRHQPCGEAITGAAAAACPDELARAAERADDLREIRERPGILGIRHASLSGRADRTDRRLERVERRLGPIGG